ncbi:MAG: hypothetical protein U0R71_03865 [Solirubrobacterales bacterium]
MTNSQPHHSKPTQPQLALLRELAMETGGSFSWPQTFDEASEEIVRLKKMKRTSRADRRRETREVRRDLAERPGDAAAVRIEDETDGYGSTARWRGSP